MTLHVIEPHGFCSGVARAIATAERILDTYPGETVYCLHEIVHNEHVVAQLRARGMVFVQSLDDVPRGALVLFSAHGVSPACVEKAAARALRVTDATCPFVKKLHADVRHFAERNVPIICIGHRHHDEVEGVAGEAPEHVRIIESVADIATLDVPRHAPVGVVSQTTFNTTRADEILTALIATFPALVLPDRVGVCYATRDRQAAVTAFARDGGLVIVLGSANSSNSQRLVETARCAGADAILISSLDALETLDVSHATRIGITSGASTPETLLEQCVARLTRATTD